MFIPTLSVSPFHLAGRIMTQTNPETIATGAARLGAEISGHLACVTINYPERHNIIDLEGWLAFPDLMARLATIRCASDCTARRRRQGVLAGADIAQFAEKFSGSSALGMTRLPSMLLTL